jgi:urease accessory protein
MLIEAPLGNLGPATGPDADNSDVDWLDLTWSECLQRALRRTTRGGVHVKILAKLGVRLRHRDVLRWALGDSPTIAVNVLPAELLIARSSDPLAIARLCYEMGNLHFPVQIQDNCILTPADGPIEALMDRLGVSYETTHARFEPTLAAPAVALAQDFRVDVARG